MFIISAVVEFIILTSLLQAYPWHCWERKNTPYFITKYPFLRTGWYGTPVFYFNIQTNTDTRLFLCRTDYLWLPRFDVLFYTIYTYMYNIPYVHYLCKFISLLRIVIIMDTRNEERLWILLENNEKVRLTTLSYRFIFAFIIKKKWPAMLHGGVVNTLAYAR